MDHVTGSTTNLAFSVLAEQHISLMHGWIPGTVQAVSVTVLLVAVGWRSRRWRLLWLPAAAAVGAGVAAWAHWYITAGGLADDPAPHLLWWWIASSGAAAMILTLGWPGAAWWRRAASLLAVPLCLLSTALVLNLWVGYFPTVQTAWNQLTAGPLPDQTDLATVNAMAATGIRPQHGSLVPVTIPDDASHFKHRGELVYLPPAWFESSPPPQLPTVMMIGGEFNTPADWARAGNAVKTIDELAAAHDGNAPVFVFVDSGGAFNNDTECVNGTRGNAADHLTKDVVPFLSATYGVSTDRRNWGIVGWSMGGTCAVDLAAMHPDLFSAFEDIAGDIAPNAGTRTQTIQRLFGGNASRYADFDPMTVIARHTYNDISAWYDISGPVLSRASRVLPAQTVAANSLCRLGTTHGMHCVVVEQPGKHDWPFAAQAFTTALPWLAGQVGTPEVLKQPLPGATAPAVTVEAARR